MLSYIKLALFIGVIPYQYNSIENRFRFTWWSLLQYLCGFVVTNLTLIPTGVLFSRLEIMDSYEENWKLFRNKTGNTTLIFCTLYCNIINSNTVYYIVQVNLKKYTRKLFQ